VKQITHGGSLLLGPEVNTAKPRLANDLATGK
jgi:hypothetical protein